MLAVLGLWLLRFLSLLPLLPLTRLLPGLTARPLRLLLTLLVALLVLHRVVAGLLPLVLLLFFIGIHVGHAVYLLKKVVKQTIADEVPSRNLSMCHTTKWFFRQKQALCSLAFHDWNRGSVAAGPRCDWTVLEAVRCA
jgi:hypothetical protein